MEGKFYRVQDETRDGEDRTFGLYDHQGLKRAEAGDDLEPGRLWVTIAGHFGDEEAYSRTVSSLTDAEAWAAGWWQAHTLRGEEECGWCGYLAGVRCGVCGTEKSSNDMVPTTVTRLWYCPTHPIDEVRQWANEAITGWTYRQMFMNVLDARERNEQERRETAG
ncbi:hypothetical protein F7Q99_27925 [Streptomyces kaniharaensis]|uniref:Uncharacterized protein n=1 Tax=Streptomyces kaniharaensis TaxID=212423 RepID=A0A6N7L091_9ACTN|nr:hypothetical protein [Streptomyces kaniharaensis]MQS15978.1 hypothetical protein [Streptomyces kaniharaensis]